MNHVCLPDEVAGLRPWVEAGAFDAAEVHVAGWIAREVGTLDHRVALAAACAVWAGVQGHVCADLDRIASVVAAAMELDERRRSRGRDEPATTGADAPKKVALPWPAVDEWVQVLAAATSVVRVVDGPDHEAVLDDHPLVLWGRRLYLQRHWVDECAIAASMRRRAALPAPAPLGSDGAALLDVLLPVLDDRGQPDLQRAAVDAALSHSVSLVVGGPGTGKTHTVSRLLAVLLHDAMAQGRELQVALAAPTGKARQRLKESIDAALEHPNVVAAVPQQVRDALMAVRPLTIHRLLGPLPTKRQRFRHDAAAPLPYDVVVIDETSMVALPLLARLLEAVRPDASLVLVGDPDQLESVELGAVLRDLAEVAVPGEGPSSPGTSSVLAGHGVRLLRSHRVEVDSPIALLADAVRSGDAPLADQRSPRASSSTDVGDGAGGGSVRFVEHDEPSSSAVVEAVRSFIEPAFIAVRQAAEAGDAESALKAVGRARILCAHRHGPHGVSTWNSLAERWLHGPTGPGRAWYPGRPLLVMSNAPRLGLSNGDTGVLVRSADRLVAVFRGEHGLLQFEPVQLDDVETAFAMTVHKSQGSEYPDVALVLPPATSPLASRELLYTGVTRTRSRLLVVGSRTALEQSVLTSSHRMTGLADALR